ncbi:MAG TPA: DNA polymerase III subunit gamma/tau [Candidatus Limnocylindrales bacterium]
MSSTSAIGSTTPHQAIYRRWRAQTFAQIVGQEAVVETLRNAVRTGRVSHAILFVGPRGTGKTSLARILAKAINCTNLQDGDPCDTCPSCVSIREGMTLDVIEIDAASNRGINEVRELRDRLQYAPTSLRRKVYILDEAHQITRDAWNALLKSLEEPPDFVVFMFASTHPGDFPPAILSRLQRYDVRRLTVPEIEGKLGRILEGDGRGADPEALHLIARLAAGGMRDAESMLDQLLSSGSDRLTEARVRDLLGLADAETVDLFLAALVDHDPAAGIAVLDEIEDRGRDLRAFLDQVVEAVRAGLVAGSTRSPGPTPTSGSHSTIDLARVGRRLASIDPTRAGIGGLRLQLELSLFDADGSPPTSARLVDASEAPSRRTSKSGPPAAQGADATSPAASTNGAADAATRRQPAARADAATAEPAVAPEPAADPERSASAEPVARAAPMTSKPVLAAASTGTDPESVAAAPVTDELARLRELWPAIVAHISAHPPTKPLIIACRPIGVEGNVVTLGFPENQEFLKDAAVRRRPNLEEGIARFLGHPVSVRCIATNIELVPDVPDEAEAAFVLAEARRIFADDLLDVGEVQ